MLKSVTGTSGQGFFRYLGACTSGLHGTLSGVKEPEDTNNKRFVSQLFDDQS